MIAWKPVTSKTRAPYAGRLIRCPECGEEMTVFHFAWSALVCAGCRESIGKNGWRVQA